MFYCLDLKYLLLKGEGGSLLSLEDIRAEATVVGVSQHLGTPRALGSVGLCETLQAVERSVEVPYFRWFLSTQRSILWARRGEVSCAKALTTKD